MRKVISMMLKSIRKSGYFGLKAAYTVSMMLSKPLLDTSPNMKTSVTSFHKSSRRNTLKNDTKQNSRFEFKNTSRNSTAYLRDSAHTAAL